jgi:hypothetical protein
MNSTMKVTAWVCIFSTSMLGCTSTSLYKPEGENQEKLYSGQIEGVVTKDGTKYEFRGDPKATIVDAVIKGISEGKEVAIPLSEVDKVLVREHDTGLTICVIVGAGLTVAAVAFIIKTIVDSVQWRDTHTEFGLDLGGK